jgi:hypothetical protein
MRLRRNKKSDTVWRTGMVNHNKTGHSFLPKARPQSKNASSHPFRDGVSRFRKPLKQLVLAATFCVAGAVASGATDCTTTDPTTSPTNTPPASPYYGSLFGATSLHNVTIGRYKEWEAQPVSGYKNRPYHFDTTVLHLVDHRGRVQ